MDRVLFTRIVRGLSDNCPYFQEGRDAIGKTGISALVKCTFAIRQLAYGAVPDSLDEYLQIGEKTSRDCLMAFCNGVMELYGEEFLRRLTQTDVEKLYAFHEKKHRIAVITEYLVNISKRRAFWSLNEDILKITILTTNTPYPSERLRYPCCTHQRPQRKHVQYAVLCSEDQLRRIRDIVGSSDTDQVAFCLLEDLTAFCFKTSLRFASRPHCVLLQDLTAFCFKTSLRFASSYHCVLLQHHCVLLKTSIAFCLKTILRFDKKLLWQNFIHHCVLLQAITACSMPPNIVLQGFQRFLQAQWNHKSLKHKEIWDKRKMLWLVGTHKKEDRRISVVDELSGSRCFQDRFVTAVKLNKVLIFIPLHQQTPQSTIISTTPETSQLTPDTNQTDELLDNLTKQMAAPCPNPLEQRFVPQYQQSTYRTSSKHPGIKHSISDGRVVVRMFKGDRIRIRGQGNALKCYNCNGSLHILQGTVLSQAVHKILLFQGQDAFTDAKPKENRYGIINQFQDLALNGG
ncbi:hypothetical protein Tco_0542627 [Tanacetum coccineum]